MSKDAKDSKHSRPDAPRQPQRKDSLSSVLSWAGLQGRTTAPKAPTASSSTPQSPQTTTSGNPITTTTARPRRHSHSAVSDIQKKARRGSTTFRAFSLSISAVIQEGPGTKTRHQKTSVKQDPKASAGTSKIGKNSSLEKGNKAASDTPSVGRPTTPSQALRGTTYQPRSPSTPVTMPKSILRVASPEGYRRPGNFVKPDAKEPISASLPSPSPSPMFVSMTPNSPPASPPDSPPMSPIQRPLSPGVRFAKATIHRVEVGPGRRFLPVKRKSKSTLTYISPLDPGSQKSAPKTMLQSPTKMRRHQENQAAMGRYWMRTEEEEAQWRAEAGRRAEEEAERYRNEPVGSRPTADKSTAGDAGVQAGKVAESNKPPPLDSKPVLDKVEEVIEDSSDSDDEEAGARCNLAPPEDAAPDSKDDRREAIEKKPEPTMSDAGGRSLGLGPEEDEAQPSTAAGTPNSTPTTTTRVTAGLMAQGSNLAKSFADRLAENQAATERAKRGASPPTTSKTATPEPSTTENSTEMSARAPTGSPSGRSTTSNNRNSSAERLAKSTPQSREKEKGKERPRAHEITA
ncbi:hypothetical protein BT67DRAFT_446856 [Trichocladium antarcticum]|uniref:Uncharacterized protein n=1 Tax=Trichocladium antarcticum TaxID=1450529 RepID=A0AAN6UU45_9PEZI|nr:hypothetical protein BT67DRAFT_446856 [Trichocladium antarcticum]